MKLNAKKGENRRKGRVKAIGIIRKSNGFNRNSIGTNRKSIAMKGNRQESTGNQKARWLAPSILSARTSYSQWERVVLCAIYYLFDPVGGEIHNPHRESPRNRKASLGHQKETKRNRKETNRNQQEINWFQQEFNRHQQEIHSHEGKQKGIHRKSKGWMACAINSERTPILLPTRA